MFWLVCSSSDAYDPLDPHGNITIKWDIISWNPDGYVVSISWLICILSIMETKTQQWIISTVHAHAQDFILNLLNNIIIFLTKKKKPEF